MAIHHKYSILTKKNPKISISQEIRSSSRINLNELPLLFSIFSNVNFDKDIKLEELFDFTMFNLALDMNNKFIVLNRSFNPTKCKNVNFVNHKGEQDFITNVSERNLNANSVLQLESYCINLNENMYIQNSMATINSSWISLEISKCNQINRDKAKNPIKCNSNVEKYINLNYNLLLTFRNSYFDPVDYENPEKYYEDTFTYGINPGVHNTITHNFVKNLLVTDYSWILENFYELESVTLRSIENEIGLSQEKLLTLNFDSPKMRNKVIRNYLKIQELIAKIGGLYSAFTLIIKTFIYDYVKFRYKLKYTCENSQIEFHRFKRKNFQTAKLIKNNSVKIQQHNLGNRNDDVNSNLGNKFEKLNSDANIKRTDIKKKQTFKTHNFLKSREDEVQKEETIKNSENNYFKSQKEKINVKIEENETFENSDEEYFKQLQIVLKTLYYAKYFIFRIVSSFKTCKKYNNIGVEYFLGNSNTEKFSFTYYLNKISFIDVNNNFLNY